MNSRFKRLIYGFGAEYLTSKRSAAATANTRKKHKLSQSAASAG